MGSPLCDFLWSSLLFDETALADDYGSLDESELRDALSAYREFAAAHAGQITKTLRATPGQFALSSGERTPPVQRLIQGAFYVERYVADDPLFAWALSVHADTIAAREIYKDDVEAPLNRAGLAATVRYLKQVTPMVEYGYLTLLPVNRMNGIADQAISLDSPVDSFERPPDELVRSLIARAWIGLTERPESVHSLVTVAFAGDKPGRRTEMRSSVLELDNPLPNGAIIRRSHGVPFRVQLRPLSEVEHLMTDAIRQFVERTAIARYQQMMGEVRLAEMVGASYTTELSLEFEALAGRIPDPRGSAEHNAAHALLYVELPYLERVDLRHLMALRSEKAEAFQALRVHLESCLRELRTVTDPGERRLKVGNTWHAIAREEVAAMARKARSQRRSQCGRALIAVAGIAGSILAPELTVQAIAAASAWGLGRQDKESYREHPAFFLWKALSG